MVLSVLYVAALAQNLPLPPMPYDYEALEPHIDAATMRVHHLKHHQTYTDKLNAALAKPVILSGAPDANAAVQLTGLRKMGIVEHLPECPIHLEEPMPQGNLEALFRRRPAGGGGRHKSKI